MLRLYALVIILLIVDPLIYIHFRYLWNNFLALGLVNLWIFVVMSMVVNEEFPVKNDKPNPPNNTFKFS